MNDDLYNEYLDSMVWMETVMQQKAEILILKDGSKIHGIIVAEENGYLVFAPGGKKTYRFDEVSGKET